MATEDAGPLKHLLPHFQLVYLPGEEPLLCPQPFGGVGSRAHKAPSGLGRGHCGGGGGREEGNVTRNRTGIHPTDTGSNRSGSRRGAAHL